MTHEEIAQMIGSSRETVTRLLSERKKKELIRLKGRLWSSAIDLRWRRWLRRTPWQPETGGCGRKSAAFPFSRGAATSCARLKIRQSELKISN
jgi:Crp-like helix-turn-helix domain